jgi:hypothetical protein
MADKPKEYEIDDAPDATAEPTLSDDAIVCPLIRGLCVGNKCNWWCDDDIIVHMTDKSITVTNCLFIGGIAGKTVKSDYDLWKEWRGRAQQK